VRPNANASEVGEPIAAAFENLGLERQTGCSGRQQRALRVSADMFALGTLSLQLIMVQPD
jgi:hypothetical protein